MNERLSAEFYEQTNVAKELDATICPNLEVLPLRRRLVKPFEPTGLAFSEGRDGSSDPSIAGG